MAKGDTTKPRKHPKDGEVRTGVGRTGAIAVAAVALLPLLAVAQEPDPFGDEIEAIEAEEKVIEEAEAAQNAANDAAARALATAKAEAPVTDPESGLQWTSEIELVEGAHYVARLHCENQIAGGQSDWRLPDVEELRAVVGRFDELGIRGETGKVVSGEIKQKTVSSIGVNADNFQPNEELVMYVFVPKGTIRQTSVENRLDKKDIGVLCVRP